jgi:MurNAc alpha-1-phosphate uridylyltransferase
MPARAILLAAGRGERMRPLTDKTPKPLLEVKGTPLIAHHLNAFFLANYTQVVINTAWLEDAITQYFGDVYLPNHTFAQSSREITHRQMKQKLDITYSKEGADFGQALETAGGIVRALPYLEDVFWVVAGDIFIPGFTFDFNALLHFERSPYIAHLFLVPNPPHHPRGDFCISKRGLALNISSPDQLDTYTYSAIGLYKKSLFLPPFCDIPFANPQGIKAPLAPLLRLAIAQDLVSAQLLNTPWTDVGTIERLRALNA